MMEHNAEDAPERTRSSAYLALLLAAVSLVFPISVYYIGGGMGAGVAFPLFRYQQTYIGTSLITLWRDIELVTSGAITGRSALVPFFWLGGILLCCIAFYFALRYFRLQAQKCRIYSGICLMGGAAVYLGGIIAQYGFSFAGSSGFSVPVGPVVLFIAGWFVASGFPGVIREPDEEDASGVASPLDVPEKE